MPKILIVDDDPDCSYLLEKILVDAGYEVAIAQTGKEALDHELCDLVLLDLSLPDMDGMNVLKAIKGKVIVLSAKVDQVEETVKEAGALKFLTKPIVPDGILSAVGECLGN